MEYKTLLFFFVIFLPGSQQGTVGGETAEGISEDIIENIRLSLRNITIPHVDYDTEKQEFGRFSGTLDDVVVTELDRFEILKMDLSSFPLGVKNLTVAFPYFFVLGKYNLNGTLIFPIGNEPLRVFGNGGMTIKFGESHSFTKLIIGSKGDQKIVKDLDIGFNITTMNVKMENLMGGGLLENVFNEYFSAIGPTIYNYYKDALFENLKKSLADAISKLLNEML